MSFVKESVFASAKTRSFHLLSLQMANACVAQVEIVFFGARFQLRTFLFMGVTKMQRPDSLGTRMRKVRRAEDLTQKELADLLGITRDAYAQYEINASNPPLHVLCKFAKQMHVTTDYLLGLSEE